MFSYTRMCSVSLTIECVLFIVLRHAAVCVCVCVCVCGYTHTYTQIYTHTCTCVPCSLCAVLWHTAARSTHSQKSVPWYSYYIKRLQRVLLRIRASSACKSLGRAKHSGKSAPWLVWYGNCLQRVLLRICAWSACKSLGRTTPRAAPSSVTY